MSDFLDPQELDLTDDSITENTRFAYPLECNPNVADGARGGHPETLVLLTADAFGVLPPVSLLEGKDVMYHFVQGFTSKLAGTEVGLTGAEATFSSCFGAPFMPLRPNVYARLLKDKMERHEGRCILLNTGWFGPLARSLCRCRWRGSGLCCVVFLQTSRSPIMNKRHNVTRKRSQCFSGPCSNRE